MKFTHISGQRLQNQLLLDHRLDSALAVVKHFGAMQSQDYPMAKWAIGARLPDISDADVDDAIASGAIVRTHVLRPTWHFAAAEDIGWMLQLSAKNIRGQMASNDKKLGLDQKTYNKCFKVIEKALEDEPLTRVELMEILEHNGIRTHEYRSGHIMAAAELESLVVSGPRKGKEHSYALMSKQVTGARNLNREEALAQLAHTYFTSHGPATIKDFQWWSGLNLADCRTGIQLNESAFQTAEIDRQTYYFVSESTDSSRKSVHLLPAFDEFLIAYKDRTPSIDATFNSRAFTSNGIFKPILVVDGQVCGIWKRIAKKDSVSIQVEPIAKVPKNRVAGIEREALRFGDFLGLKTEFKLLQ